MITLCLAQVSPGTRFLWPGRRQPWHSRQNGARVRRGRKESPADPTDTPCRSPKGRSLLARLAPRQPAKPFSLPGQTRRPRRSKSRVSGPTHSPPTDPGRLPGSQQPPRRRRPHGACWESRCPALRDSLPFGIPPGTPGGSLPAPHSQLQGPQERRPSPGAAHRVSRKESRSAPPEHVLRRTTWPRKRTSSAWRAGPARGLRAAGARTSARRAPSRGEEPRLAVRVAAAAGVGLSQFVTPGAADPTGGPRDPRPGSRRGASGVVSLAPVPELRGAGAATVPRPRQRTAAAGAPPLCAVSYGVRLRGHGEARADPGPRPSFRPQIQR